MSKRLHLRIGRKWSTTDFSTCLQHLNRLYQHHLVIEMGYADFRELEKYLDHPLPSRLRRYWTGQLMRDIGLFGPNVVEAILTETDQLESILAPQEVLRVCRVRYASPGSIDFVGIGQSIDAVCRFVQFLIEHVSNRKLRKVDLEIKEEELREKRFDNAMRHVSLLKKMGQPETEIRRLVAITDESQGVLIDLIENSKIQGVATSSDKSDG